MYTIEQLDKELRSRIINPGFQDLLSMRDWFSGIEIENIKNSFDFEEDSYCRIPLLNDDKFDLLLCCWKPGQLSPFHGHPRQGCLVKILKGTLSEEVRFTDGRTQKRKNIQGSVAYINDTIGVHRVENITTENAVSLHLYAPGGYIPVYMEV